MMQSLKQHCRCLHLPLRPLRPTNLHARPLQLRSLTHHSNPRITLRNSRSQIQIITLSKCTRRPITTNTKQYLLYQGRIVIYGAVVVALALGSGLAFLRLLQKDWLDKLYPTPKEWWWLPRKYYRILKHNLETNDAGNTDWSLVARASLEAISLLENGWEESPYAESYPNLPVPQSWQAAPLKKQYDWDTTIPGFEDEKEMLKHPGGELWSSKIGPDISMQPEPWRRGYVELHMVAAKAWKLRYGCYTLRGPQKVVYRPEYVMSDDNPDPLDMPANSAAPNRPHIDDCRRSFPSPDQAYTRLLTMKGTTRTQKIDAGIAYAKWMAATDRVELAERLHRWALQLACEGVERPDAILNEKTGVIKANAPFITSNILNSTSALAEHLARHGNTSQALNIYLSVLRSRREAPEAPRSQQFTPRGPDYSCTSMQSVLKFITHLPWEGEYPSPPPSGDEPYRQARNKQCEEAGTISHVAEILFAKSDRKEQALQFVEDAADQAQAGFYDKRLTRREWKVCRDCLETSLINWVDMLEVIVAEKVKRDGAAAVQGASSLQSTTVQAGIDQSGSSGQSTWDKLMSLVWTPKTIDNAMLDETDWVTEFVRVRRRLAKYHERKLLAAESGGLRPVGEG